MGYTVGIVHNSYKVRMSLFYKKDDEEPQYPELDEHKKPAQEEKKKPQQGDVFDRANAGRGSVFLEKDREPEKEEGLFSRCCPCCQLSYYKDYFKVTNKDVYKRILCNLKFWGGGFFQPVDQQYDLYGPFWLYTTMIFAVGAVHNVLIYENQPNNFEYDFKVIGVALTVFYLIGMGLSAVIGLLFGCMGLQSKTSQIVCLYGYSMATYVICVLLCSINMTLLTWLFLLYGAGTKIAYVLKNVFESLEVPTSKKFLITIIVIVEASLQLLIIKFAFIKTGGKEASVFSHHMALPDHQEAIPFLHLRQFQGNL